jgi:hypothetical protein
MALSSSSILVDDIAIIGTACHYGGTLTLGLAEQGQHLRGIVDVAIRQDVRRDSSVQVSAATCGMVLGRYRLG